MLMANKVGSLVAIEPSTGEILTMVSSPGIDVDMLADIGQHYKDISTNPYKLHTLRDPYSNSSTAS